MTETPALITSFKGRYAFLSNFNHTPFSYAGHDWPTAEHAFQAGKAASLFDFQKVRQAGSPGEAKRLGRSIPCREDWEQVKRELMLSILLAKFSDPDLRHQLVATMPAMLIEENTWGDLYWGAVRWGMVKLSGGPLFQADDRSMWVGHNWLGRLLMVVRGVHT
jgi:ribA/ribD-fused uncharacterized protein